MPGGAHAEALAVDQVPQPARAHRPGVVDVKVRDHHLIDLPAAEDLSHPAPHTAGARGGVGRHLAQRPPAGCARWATRSGWRPPARGRSDGSPASPAASCRCRRPRPAGHRCPPGPAAATSASSRSAGGQQGVMARVSAGAAVCCARWYGFARMSASLLSLLVAAVVRPGRPPNPASAPAPTSSTSTRICRSGSSASRPPGREIFDHREAILAARQAEAGHARGRRRRRHRPVQLRVRRAPSARAAGSTPWTSSPSSSIT